MKSDMATTHTHPHNDLYCDLTPADTAVMMERIHSSGSSADEAERHDTNAKSGGDADQQRPPHQRKGFKGYTLEEMRFRRALTGLKIEMTTDKLRLMASPKMQKDVKTVTGYMTGFENVLRYVDYAFLAYNVTRRIGSFFARFGFRKSK